MVWTAPRTWVAGESPTAANFNTHVRDNLLAMTEWATYTPTIANVTTSTLAARYISAGKLVKVRARFTLTAAPTGTVTVTLPVTASTAIGTGQGFPIGMITGLRQGTGYRVATVYQSSSTVVSFQSDSSATAWANAVPVAWANTDVWSFYCEYEAA